MKGFAMYPTLRNNGHIDGPRQAECIAAKVKLFRRVAEHFGGQLEWRDGMFYAFAASGVRSVFGLGFPLSALRGVFSS